MARAYAPGSLLFYFASYIARHLVGISVGIGSNRRRKLLYIQMVMAVVEYRPGAPEFHQQLVKDNCARAARPLRRHDGSPLQ
jgi:hypothetical protein